MYVRLRKNKSGTTTVYLIHSVREEGKNHASSKVVKCFGSSADEATIEKWRLEGEKLKEELNNNSNKITLPRNLNEILSCTTEELGSKYLYSEIFKLFFSNLKLKNVNLETLMDLVVMRIIKPVSKLKTANISETFGIKDLTINKIYKLMDNIDDKNIDIIKKQIFKTTKKLLNNQIKIMFYDLTTIYFEVNSTSDLKEFGFSKDGKSQHVQVSLALIVSDEGLPVGYEIFKGNIFEGATLIPVLKKLKEDYKVEDVTIVADSAMLSSKNIEAMLENNYKFIVAARIKNMDNKIKSQILDENLYQIMSEDKKYKTIELTDKKKLISVFSNKRKEKDEYDREKALERISKLVGQNSKSGLRGALKKQYVKVSDDSIIEIDQKKIEDSKKFDGYFGFITNTNLPPEQVIAQYKGLWQVEQSFRINKHNLKIRPVYHYVDRRIKAHFAICFLSFAIVRYLEYKLKLKDLYIPIEKLNEELNNIKLVKIFTDTSENYIITDIQQNLINIFKALNLPVPISKKLLKT